MYTQNYIILFLDVSYHVIVDLSKIFTLICLDYPQVSVGMLSHRTVDHQCYFFLNCFSFIARYIFTIFFKITLCYIFIT